MTRVLHLVAVETLRAKTMDIRQVLSVTVITMRVRATQEFNSMRVNVRQQLPSVPLTQVNRVRQQQTPAA